MNHRPHRKPNRLKTFDYAKEGYYFITTCTHNRREWFGIINGGEMILNECGVVVKKCWENLPNHYPAIELDSFVIMPNHVHGIIVIKNIGNGLVDPLADSPGGNGLKPLPTDTQSHKLHGLPEFIRGFKTFSSRRIHETLTHGKQFRWQKSYYDHIIRDEISLKKIREYIQSNPLKWDLDTDNPAYAVGQDRSRRERFQTVPYISVEKYPLDI